MHLADLYKYLMLFELLLFYFGTVFESVCMNWSTTQFQESFLKIYFHLQ